MNIAKIVRFADYFLSVATAEKLPENTNDIKLLLANIEKLNTYHARIKYCEKNLKHLSSGSSRVVYKLNDKSVLKLAKNEKGLAQNKAECQTKIKSKYINLPTNHASNYFWVEAPLLKKITEAQFKKITGVSFKDFDESVDYGLKNVSGSKDKEKPEKFEEIEKTKIYKEIKEISNKLKLMPGDIGRLSSWCIKNDIPVLIDTGLTRKIFDDFYE